MVKCLEMVQDLSKTTTTTAAATVTASATIGMATNMGNGSIPRSPNGVLDAACLSYKIDETTVGSCPSSSHTSPVTKRRKLD